MKTLTLKHLNKIAAKDGLELVKGEGYFYWWALEEGEVSDRISQLETTSIYVVHFNRMNFDRWLLELEDIKEQLSRVDIVSSGGLENAKLELRTVK